MGNDIEIDTNKETIIWIDSNVFNSENKTTYNDYLSKFKNFNFIRFSSVKKAIDFIINKKCFEFRLLYGIVSGRLAEEFFTQSVQISEKKNIVIATSVYCFRQNYHETKPYFKDRFLNTGGITYNFDDIVKYILKDECEWNKIPQRYKKYIPNKESNGNNFTKVNINNYYELALPILVGTLINASLLEREDITNFQKLLLGRYANTTNSEINYLIKPSGNKNINIPLHLITKYLLRFYTSETPKFYADLNKDLSNDKFDDYHPFIFLLYDALNKGSLKSYKEGCLYRGCLLSNSEFQEMKNNFEKSKNDKSIKAIYYSKKFLSFSKNIFKAKSFLENLDGCTTILFILQKPKNKEFFVSNIDTESYSIFTEEREVLFLPLSCFEITEITREQYFIKKKYIIVKLKYLDDYAKEIKTQIENIKESEEAINDFFINSLKSKFGEDVQKFYDKKSKFTVRFSQYIGASPKNNYFLNKIGTGFIHKINKYLIKDESPIHLDDEIPNILGKENKIKKFFKSILQKFGNKEKKISKFMKDLMQKLDKKQFDNGYSIGICLGNFLYNFDSFYNAPTKEKAFNLATLALAAGLPAIKLIPKMKDIIKTKLFDVGKYNINVSTLLNGLNILYAVSFELYSIFDFSLSHKNNITKRYIVKRGLKLTIGIGFALLGNILGKLAIAGVNVILGITLGPLATIVIGLLAGVGCGYLGAKVGDKIGDMVFGKDEFVLISSHLYYKYIPLKYRQEFCNPNLKWNKTYLCANVKSYIIECIVNETDYAMLLINIPNDVYEIDECLGKGNKYIGDDDDSKSESTDMSDDEGKENFMKIFKNGKMIGDLIIPYKGIDENCFSINFVIYGINEEKISYKDWLGPKKNEKTIEIVFNLSVY